MSDRRFWISITWIMRDPLEFDARAAAIDTAARETGALEISDRSSTKRVWRQMWFTTDAARDRFKKSVRDSIRPKDRTDISVTTWQSVAPADSSAAS